MEKDYNEQPLEHEAALNEGQSPIDAPGATRTANELHGSEAREETSYSDTETAESDQQEEDAPSNATTRTDNEEVPALRADRQEDSADEDEEDRLTIPEVLPVLPLKETVIYPFSVQ